MFAGDAYAILQSRATKPLFYRAPHPASVEPHPYQLAGVEYALARDHCLIGDEPGLGKTCQAIMISNALGAKRTLVICPASLRLNWEKEIKMWSTVKPRPQVNVILSQKNGINKDFHYNVISYDLLRNLGIHNAIKAVEWDHVTLDEAHAIKDPKGNKRSNFICSVLPPITKRFTLLSGTPSPNQPIELYNMIRLLDHAAIDGMSVEAFREHYYDVGGGMINARTWDAVAKAYRFAPQWSNRVRNVPRRLDELQARLRSRVMIRRQKGEVLSQLPRKQFNLVPLAKTAEARAALAHPGWAAAQQLYDMDPAEFQAALPIDGEVSTARRLLGEAKVGPACDYVEELLLSGVNKVVVSAWHTSVLSVARERLSRFGLVYMDGGTSAVARQKAVDSFQSDPATRIILGQTMCLGEGWTLTEAQDVVLLEPDYVPGRITQMVDRIHRIGQKGDYILAHLPIFPETLDERIVATAIEKDRNIFLSLDAQK